MALIKQSSWDKLSYDTKLIILSYIIEYPKSILKYPSLYHDGFDTSKYGFSQYKKFGSQLNNYISSPDICYVCANNTGKWILIDDKIQIQLANDALVSQDDHIPPEKFRHFGEDIYEFIKKQHNFDNLLCCSECYNGFCTWITKWYYELMCFTRYNHKTICYCSCDKCNYLDEDYYYNCDHDCHAYQHIADYMEYTIHDYATCRCNFKYIQRNTIELDEWYDI
jgi:hypothetical protein